MTRPVDRCLPLHIHQLMRLDLTKVQVMMFLNKTSPKAGYHGMGQAPLRKNPSGLVWRYGLLVIGVGGFHGHD